MKMKRLFGFFLASLAMVTVVSCKPDNPRPEEKVYTYNTYTAISPTNWNELTYQDNNDTQIMSYIGSSFFSFDFKFDAKGEIIPGEFVIRYDAATKLEDVSAKYVGSKWGIPEGATARAYKITLRNDLKWEDGTAIKAEDFVYSMEEQLNPLFKNYRADSFYVGSTIIHNAENYVKQGSYNYALMIPSVADEYYVAYGPETSGFQVSAEGTLQVVAGEVVKDVVINVNDGGSWGSNGINAYYKAGYLAGNEEVNTAIGNLIKAADSNGYVKLTVERANALCEAIAILQGYESAAKYAEAVGSYAYQEWQEFCYYGYVFEKMDFSEVGLFVGDTEYELVMVLDKALDLLKEDGSLSYKAAYNMSSLPLVHKGRYEANKHAPQEGSTLWTSSYNSNKDTTMSWGPYKLTYYQEGKQYILSRNTNWYGYNMPENKGKYQTDRIVCETIKEWGTAWLAFLKGEIDSIGIDVSISTDYKESERAINTPDDFVASLQLQSNVEELKKRESEGVNKTILGYTEFRKALSLSIDRAEFTRKTTTSSRAGFGLYNQMHYYDVANGGVYRNTDEARKVLCEIYAVDPSKYPSLEEAEKAITGYNIAEARRLVEEAYNKALAAGDIKATDKVVLTLGTGAINEVVTRRFDFLKSSWLELVKGTSLEGRLDFEVKDFADKWSDDFRDGLYDVCMGGWTGAAWDPGYFLLAYLSPSYMYSKAWDTSSVEMTFTMKGVAEDGGDITATMPLMTWYNCLNGAAGAPYNWSSSAIPESKRLQLIAALEQQILSVYYTVPLYNNYASSLLSWKVEYATTEYNTFMSYGGIRYMTYKYSDAEWKAEVAKQGGELNYK